MVEKLNTLLPKVEAAPQMQKLNIPKLKKIKKEKINLNELA